MKARHELLLRAIGTVPEEDDAYIFVLTLMWALPLFITLATLADLSFIYIYMTKAHPWIGILRDEEEEKSKKQKEKEEKKEKKLQKKQSKTKNAMKRHFPPDFM